MGIPDHLTYLLRNLYMGQEATIRTLHRTTDWSKIGKEYIKPVYCYLAYLTYMQSLSVQDAGVDELQAEIKTVGRNYQQLQICR